MYLKPNRRRKDGKEHFYWNIVESKRCAGGRVVQRQVLYLGEINDCQRAAWCPVVEAFDDSTPILGWSRRMRSTAAWTSCGRTSRHCSAICASAGATCSAPASMSCSTI